MPPQDLEVLASNIVDRLPSVLERLRKYDQQNGLLEIQCAHLESEITLVRSSMVTEQDKQEKIKKCIAEIKTMIGPRKKRLRDDEENNGLQVIEPAGAVIPRMRKRRRTPSEESCSSIVSTRTKRRGKLFSEEEADLITHRNE